MSLKLFNSAIESGEKLVENIGEAFDKNFTSQEERIEAKGKIIADVNNLLISIAQAQAQAIQSETSGNWLQRSWRPLVMLSFAFIVIYAFFLQPAFFPEATQINAILPDYFWELLKIGMGGYVIGRSAEKIAQNVGTNIQITRKK